MATRRMWPRPNRIRKTRRASERAVQQLVTATNGLSTWHREAGKTKLTQLVGGVVRAEDGVDAPGVDTRDDHHPRLHGGPLLGGVGDQKRTCIVKNDIGVYLTWDIKHLSWKIGDSMFLEFGLGFPALEAS